MKTFIKTDNGLLNLAHVQSIKKPARMSGFIGNKETESHCIEFILNQVVDNACNYELKTFPSKEEADKYFSRLMLGILTKEM